MSRSLAILTLLLLATFAGGCNILGFFGALEAERRRTGETWVEAEYTGLEGQTVAVVVDASREIHMTSPRVVGAILTEVIARLENSAGAESIVSAAEVQSVLYDEPGLLDRTYDEVAARFGVTRLIVIQLDDFRLTEAGNEYVWDGRATGNVIVVEADSYIEDDVRLEHYVNVKYPFKPNTTVDEMPAEAVALELLRRFSNRVSWYFYRHKERYPEYREY
jgi:hypothetical protein